MLFAAPLFFTSCDPDPIEPTPTTSGYENGVLMINEGPFLSGTGTVFHYDRNTKVVKADIFSLENGGAKVGNILQSAATNNGKTYLLVNNANRVLVVDAKTFQFKDSIKGIQSPRFFQVIDNNKAYISNWNTGISVVDLTTNKVTKQIKTGIGADRMLRDGSRMLVLNSGGFDKDSSITVIDVTTDAVTKTIKTDPGPNSIVAANGSIWVLCGSYFDLKSKGRLVEYKNDVIVNSYEVPKYSSNLVASKDGKTLYFLADNAICIKNATDSKIAPTVFIEKANNATFGGLYALGVDSKDGTLFCGDAKTFTSNGTVYLFDTTTKIAKDSIKSGIGTNGFLFGN